MESTFLGYQSPATRELVQWIDCIPLQSLAGTQRQMIGGHGMIN